MKVKLLENIPVKDYIIDISNCIGKIYEAYLGEDEWAYIDELGIGVMKGEYEIIE